jgi:hypothetical protein
MKRDPQYDNSCYDFGTTVEEVLTGIVDIEDGHPIVIVDSDGYEFETRPEALENKQEIKGIIVNQKFRVI